MSRHHETKPTREKLQRLGDLLIDSTDEVLKNMRHFINKFNRTFEFIYVKEFVFEHAGYKQICENEVREIRDIFKLFDIRIKELSRKSS